MRAVVPIRLGSAERAQIARASERRNVTLSGFIREAALAASALIEGKVSVRPSSIGGVFPDGGVRPSLEPEKTAVAVLDLEPPASVDEAPWRPHHFVEGQCVGCGLDVDDTRGRDRSCEPVRVV